METPPNTTANKGYNYSKEDSKEMGQQNTSVQHKLGYKLSS